MTLCGNPPHSHHMMSVGDLLSMNKVAVYKGTITAVDRVNNCADITYSTSTTRHSFIIDEDVPFFYHCPESDGSEEALEDGNKAFMVTDSVYVFHYPGDTQETSWTYIVGHADIKGLRECESEYVLIRQGSHFTIFDVGSAAKLDLATIGVPGDGGPTEPLSLPADYATYTSWLEFYFAVTTSPGVSVPYTQLTNGQTDFSTAPTVYNDADTIYTWLDSCSEGGGSAYSHNWNNPDYRTIYETVGFSFTPPTGIESPEQYSGCTWEGYLQKWTYGVYPVVKEADIVADDLIYSPVVDDLRLLDTSNSVEYLFRTSLKHLKGATMTYREPWSNCLGTGTADINNATFTYEVEVKFYDPLDPLTPIETTTRTYTYSRTNDTTSGDDPVFTGTYCNYSAVGSMGPGIVCGEFGVYFVAGVAAQFNICDASDYDLDTSPGWGESWGSYGIDGLQWTLGDPTLTETWMISCVGSATLYADIPGFSYDVGTVTLTEVLQSKNTYISQQLAACAEEIAPFITPKWQQFYLSVMRKL